MSQARSECSRMYVMDVGNSLGVSLADGAHLPGRSPGMLFEAGWLKE